MRDDHWDGFEVEVNGKGNKNNFVGMNISGHVRTILPSVTIP